MNITIENLHAFSAFWLMFSKWLAAIIQIPHFDDMAIPARVKVLFALLISLAFSPILMPIVSADLSYLGMEYFWMAQIFYLVTGLFVGQIIKSIMFVFQAAGSLITLQMGFGAVSYFDPTTASQVGPFEKLIRWTVLVMIISTPALNPIFQGLLSSFHFISIKHLLVGQINFDLIFSFFKGIILSAITLASPFIFTNVFVNCLLGIISRLVPQMNIVMVSFVANISVGLLVFVAISNEFFETALNIYAQKLSAWFKIIHI